MMGSAHQRRKGPKRLHMEVLVKTTTVYTMFFPKQCNSVSTLRGSCGRNKGRCLIKVLHLLAGIFPPNFRVEIHIMSLWLRRLAQSVRPNLAQGLSKFLVRRSCGDPSETLSEACAWSCTGLCAKKRSWWHPLRVLTWSGTGPCEKLLWRSCWNPQEVPALRSWRSSAWLLVWKFVLEGS